MPLAQAIVAELITELWTRLVRDLEYPEAGSRLIHVQHSGKDRK